MTKLPESVKRAVEALSELPSIGPRQARRLVFYLLSQGTNSLEQLSLLIRDLKKIKPCAQCFFIHENPGPLCTICSDPKRNQKSIMLVEKETDLLSIENTGKFTGRYCIIGSIPKTGILEAWQKLRLKELQTFIEKELAGKADEIILAFNPSAVGDFNASILAKELGVYGQVVTRLGRGLPTGGEIEFADEDTLGSSIDGRG